IPDSPFNPPLDAYYKTNPLDEFPYDTATGTGAILGNAEIELYIRDNVRPGDYNPLTGTIDDPGGPAHFVPLPALSGPTIGVSGQRLAFAVKAADLSDAKRAAGFTYSIDWGDGSPPQVIPRAQGNANGVPLNHVYGANGKYQITVRASDLYGISGQ